MHGGVAHVTWREGKKPASSGGRGPLTQATCGRPSTPQVRVAYGRREMVGRPHHLLCHSHQTLPLGIPKPSTTDDSIQDQYYWENLTSRKIVSLRPDGSSIQSGHAGSVHLSWGRPPRCIQKKCDFTLAEWFTSHSDFSHRNLARSLASALEPALPSSMAAQSSADTGTEVNFRHYACWATWPNRSSWNARQQSTVGDNRIQHNEVALLILSRKSFRQASHAPRHVLQSRARSTPGWCTSTPGSTGRASTSLRRALATPCHP